MAQTASDSPIVPDRRPQRGVLTFAYGRHQYVEMAINLALSLERHDPDVPRAVVTDSDDPRLEALYAHVIRLEGLGAGGYLPKLYMDRYTPFRETLFIDCDSFVLDDLGELWAMHGGASISVQGHPDDNPLRFFDPHALPADMRRPFYPAFNGGVYYFRDDALAHSVFERARTTLPHYDAWGLRRLNGKVADEPLMSLAFAYHWLPCVEGDGGMRCLISIGSWVRLDVLAGRCAFKYYDSVVEPAIVHFGEHETRTPLYRREALKLRLARNGASRVAASIRANGRFPGAGGDLPVRQRLRTARARLTRRG